MGEELERIRSERGVLTPDEVLKEAENPDSPLHEAFEWDNDAAARQHRLTQARRLIVSIRIINPPTAKPMTAFVSVRDPEHGRTYMPTVQALTSDDLRARLLMEARQMIESLERRYQYLVDAGDILDRLRKATA